MSVSQPSVMSVAQFVSKEVAQDVFGIPTHISHDRIIKKASRTVNFIGRFVALLHEKGVISDNEVRGLCNKSTEDFTFKRDKK